MFVDLGSIMIKVMRDEVGGNYRKMPLKHDYEILYLMLTWSQSWTESRKV
jgi:hypothetical protein